MKKNWHEDGYVQVVNYLGSAFLIPGHATKVFRRFGTLDYELIKIVEAIFKDNQASYAIDVGANIGNHTIAFSKLFSRVVAIEPLSSILPIRYSLDLSGAKNVQLVEAALGSSENVTYINVAANLGGGGSTAIDSLARSSKERVRVDVKVGDDLLEDIIKDGAVDFIKIDVEGMEADVISGLNRTIKKYSPILAFEWNNAQTQMKFEEEGIFEDLLRDYDFFGVLSATDRRGHSGFIGIMRRLYVKLTNKAQPRLVKFNKREIFNNVLAVPKTSHFKENRYEMLNSFRQDC